MFVIKNPIHLIKSFRHTKNPVCDKTVRCFQSHWLQYLPLHALPDVFFPERESGCIHAMKNWHQVWFLIQERCGKPVLHRVTHLERYFHSAKDYMKNNKRIRLQLIMNEFHLKQYNHQYIGGIHLSCYNFCRGFFQNSQYQNQTCIYKRS